MLVCDNCGKTISKCKEIKIICGAFSNKEFREIDSENFPPLTEQSDLCPVCYKAFVDELKVLISSYRRHKIIAESKEFNNG